MDLIRCLLRAFKSDYVACASVARRKRLDDYLNVGLRPYISGATVSLMSEDASFTHEPERDIEGHVRIRSTCKRCGASKLVNVANGTLRKWEEGHRCPNLPKRPPKFAGLWSDRNPDQAV